MSLVAENVYWVGVNDYPGLFEEIWPIRHGISYNSYLVVGEEKTALIDTVKRGFEEELVSKVREVLGGRNLDFVVINHAEPDHTGALPRIAEEFSPRVVASKLGAAMLRNYYGLSGVEGVGDGDTLDLGGISLKFVSTPWVHWPETMMTYVPEGGVLFPCDGFGSYGALGKGIFDDEVDMDFYLREAKKYMATVVYAYSNAVLRAVKRLRGMEIRVVAPSHGPIYRRNPGLIIDLYERWAKPVYARTVVVLYGSMYGFTREVAEAIAEGVEGAGLRPLLHNASRDDLSEVMADIIDAPAIVFGAPTYDTDVFPPVENIVRIIRNRRISGRVAAVFGSYGWGGGAVEKLAKMLGEMGFRVVGKLGFRGSGAGVMDRARELGRRVAEEAERVVEG